MNLNEIKLEVVAKEKKDILENLISLYLHDLSVYAGDLKISRNGKFEYEGIDFYFSREDLKPFFICLNGEIVGFLLFNSGKFVPKGIDYNVHELFVLKVFRKKGIAGTAVKKLFKTYRGIYQIEQLVNNETAVMFWKHFYRKEGIRYSEKVQLVDGFECCIQKIELI